ncbi:hypothetical protein PINS_up017450 [Pythium insidiosum]|nr:hypothetical protein PINS_up017450 [Pythium insidiosum]
MRLQPSDLDDWRDDPEAFVTLSESLTAAESLRVCAENLFLTLLEHARDDTIPVLTRLTATATEALARLRKDSVDDSGRRDRAGRRRRAAGARPRLLRPARVLRL